MDVLLDFPSDILEGTTPSLPAFCLPIISLVQSAGEVVWISHRRGLGMPRHRKTRLLHWPAYRLLFLIRVLDWKQIFSGSNREQGVVIFFICKTFSHIAPASQTAWCWKPHNWSEKESPYLLLAQTWVQTSPFFSQRKDNRKPSQIIIPLIFSCF